MTAKQKTALITFTTLAVIVIAFFVVSLCLASVHEVGLIAEWQSWFGKVAEEVTEDPEQTEEVVETAINVIRSIVA